MQKLGHDIRVLAIRVLVVVAGTVVLAGCAQQGPTNGDPGPRPLPTGYTCQSLRGELNKLDSRGVPSKVEASSQGKKLAPADKAEVEKYNSLLNGYLGARCHV